MKKMTIGISTTTMPSAFAVDLENRDSEPHQVTITEASTEKITLEAGASQTVRKYLSG